MLAERKKDSSQCRVARRRRWLLIAVAGLIGCALPAWSQIGLVHVTTCGPGTFPGTVCTIPATTAGNLLVVGWQIGGGANTSTSITAISDNVGNSYVEAGAAKSIDSSAGSANDIWYAKNIAGGSTSLTITTSATVNNAGLMIWEFSGADQNAPLDTSAVSNSQSASATPSGAPVTTTGTSDAVVSIVAVANDVTGIVSGNAFTNDALLKSNGWAHLITTSSGAYAAQWNQDAAGSYASSTAAFKSAVVLTSNACDLNGDGVVNGTDVNLSVNMALGTAPCSANLEGPLVCTVVTVQRVINASEGQPCVTYNGHGVTLSWVASSSPGVSGYNVYRGTASTGPFAKVNTSLVGGTSYADNSVQAGQTYYYVITAINSSGLESGFSTPAVTATIPIP
jgi:hypothetical protein